MSLLATYASDYNNLNIENKNNETNMPKKRNIKNKTLKRRQSKDNAKMEAMLNAINDEDEEDNLTNFEPLAPPSISKIEQFHNNQNPIKENVIENFEDLPSEYAKQYYQQYVPYVNQEDLQSKQNSESNNNISINKINKPAANSDLQTKLDYLIYLLENNSNEKTNCLTEELILYSFLGIFTIFIVDSFAKVGKYIR